MTAPHLSFHSIEPTHPIGPIHLVAKDGKLLALDFGSPDGRLMRLLLSRFGVDVVLGDCGDLDDIATADRQQRGSDRLWRPYRTQAMAAGA